MTTLVQTRDLSAPVKIRLAGTKVLVFGQLSWDTGDYVTNGIAVTAASFGLTTIDRIIFNGCSSILGANAYFDKANLKVKLFVDDIAGVSAEMGASALTAQSLAFIAVGDLTDGS